MKRRQIRSGHPVRPPDRRTALRAALAGLGSVPLAGCDRLSHDPRFVKLLGSAETLNRHVQPLIASRQALAQEFSPADIAASFKPNGTLEPADPAWQALRRDGFRDWRLEVGGLVDRPARFSLVDLRGLPSRTQITRHDCVEGWSAIGQWTGVPLSRVLDRVRPLPRAKYVVFHCADSMEDAAEGDSRYYESIDLDDAYHVQTILAYELNGETLPVANGAPLRLRVERQLGYKHAKYLMRIELVESFEGIRGGAGGYWEDNGYEWYAGI